MLFKPLTSLSLFLLVSFGPCVNLSSIALPPALSSAALCLHSDVWLDFGGTELHQPVTCALLLLPGKYLRSSGDRESQDSPHSVPGTCLVMGARNSRYGWTCTKVWGVLGCAVESHISSCILQMAGFRGSVPSCFPLPSAKKLHNLVLFSCQSTFYPVSFKYCAL